MLKALAAEAAISEDHAHLRCFDRLALQIVGLRLMGYAGIHLSGVHTPDELVALEQRISIWVSQIDSLKQWQPAWEASWHLDGQRCSHF